MCDGNIDGPPGLPAADTLPGVNAVAAEGTVAALDPDGADVSQTNGIPQAQLPGLAATPAACS